MNKAGQSAAIIGFLLLGLVVVFGLYLVAVPMSKVWDDVSEQLTDEEALGSDNKTVEVLDDYGGFVTPAMDQIVTIAFMGIILTLMVISIFFTDHPVFIVFLLIGFVVIVIIGSQLVNVADTAVRDDALEDQVDNFKLSSLIFGSNLPIILAVVAIVAILIIMSRTRGVAA